MAGGRRILLAALAAWALSASPVMAKGNYPSGILRLLKAAHFKFIDKDEYRGLKPIGALLVGGKQYEIWQFSWSDPEKSNLDSSSHENLIILEQTGSGLFYVGAYDIGDAQVWEAKGRAIWFRHPPGRLSDRIIFNDSGPPPQAVIGGITRRFARQSVPFPAGWNAPDYRSGMWKVLFDAGFGGHINSDVRIEPIGSIPGRGKSYEIWRYVWEETPETKAASTEHGAYKVLVFEKGAKGMSFLGHYAVSGEHFHVQGHAIKFQDEGKPSKERRASAKQGEEIAFGADGPPSLTYFEGEFLQFEPAAHAVGVWQALEDGEFSGSTDVDAKVSRAGTIATGAKQYEIWNYGWVEDPHFRRVGVSRAHEDYRVLVFERKGAELSYMGSYKRGDTVFHVEGRAVKFDVPKSGKPVGYLTADPGEGIVFTEKGPPIQARFNWATRELVR